MNCHQDVLKLEVDIQSRITRWMDEHSLDNSHLQNLAEPLDVIMQLFTSLHLPSNSSKTANKVEATLNVLNSLMESCESSFQALQLAREEISTVSTRNVYNQQYLLDFASQASKEFQNIKSQLVTLHEVSTNSTTENQMLKHRLLILQRERVTQDGLIINLANKLNESEETNLELYRRNKKVEMQVEQLQLNLQGKRTIHSGAKKWKAEFEGRPLMRETLKNPIGWRERSNEYSEKLAVRKIITSSR